VKTQARAKNKNIFACVIIACEDTGKGEEKNAFACVIIACEDIGKSDKIR
jgi:hypothetical protein